MNAIEAKKEEPQVSIIDEKPNFEIIVEKSQEKGIVHKLKGFLCVISFRLIKCP